MIFTERTIMVVNDSATINKPLILYRGDKNIELKITIAESQFKFRNNDASNVIETTDASYAQLVINTPYGSPIFSDVAATKNGAVIFVISAAMIDEIREVGAYEIQIRLLDDNKQSRASIPPVSNAIEIREPIAIEDGSAVDSNAVNVAKVNRALTTTSAPLEAFDSQGNYIKKTWGDGDPITDAALNKMEAGIDGVNKKIGNVRSQIKDKVDKSEITTVYKNIAYYSRSELLTPSCTGTNEATYLCNLTPYTELEVGKYLIYVDVNVNITTLPQGRVVPYVFSGNSVTMIDINLQNTKTSYIQNTENFNSVISYGIVDVTSKGNYRIGFSITEQNTNVTNIYSISVNKVYAIKIDTINNRLIKALNNKNYSNYVVVSNYVENSDYEADIKNIEADIKNIEDTISKYHGKQTEIICYGDSMTGAMNGWVKALQDIYEVNTINRGIGGQTAGQIASRQGGVELLCQPFTIPADTSQTPVTCNYNLYAQQSSFEGINPCYINGVKGILRNSSNTADGFTFQRSEAGNAVTITRPTSIITDNMVNNRNKPMIIWVGTNGDYTNTSRDANKLIEIIDSMISFAETSKYIVIGLTTDVSQGIPAINEKLKSKYGRRFLDLRTYLIQYGLDDLGIAATTDDTNRIANNNVPTSLMSDNTHLTMDCQQKIVAKLVYKKLQDLFMI